MIRSAVPSAEGFPANPDWTDSAKLKDDKYLTAVTAGVYVMAANGDPGLFRSGVIGIQHMTNNARKRLVQLKGGTLKHEGPWEFVFLAPLPGDLGTDLRKAEVELQNALAAEFEVGRNAKFRTHDINRIQEVASHAVSEFMTSMAFDGSSTLERALEDYIDAVRSGQPRHANARSDVMKALRMCLDGPLASRLLAGLK